MAMKPTVYKADIQLVDTNRDLYPNAKLTLAKHSSETDERLLVRILAYALNYHEQLSFCRGLSATDEADLWQISDTGQIEQWIEVGLPTPERIRKAVSRSPSISIYAYGRDVDTWWKRSEEGFNGLRGVAVWCFDHKELEPMIQLINRNMILSITLSGNEIYLSSDDIQGSLTLSQLL